MCARVYFKLRSDYSRSHTPYTYNVYYLPVQLCTTLYLHYLLISLQGLVLINWITLSYDTSMIVNSKNWAANGAWTHKMIPSSNLKGSIECELWRYYWSCCCCCYENATTLLQSPCLDHACSQGHTEAWITAHRSWYPLQKSDHVKGWLHQRECLHETGEHSSARNRD